MRKIILKMILVVTPQLLDFTEETIIVFQNFFLLLEKVTCIDLYEFQNKKFKIFI